MDRVQPETTNLWSDTIANADHLVSREEPLDLVSFTKTADNWCSFKREKRNALSRLGICGTAENSIRKSAIAAYDVQAPTRWGCPRAEATACTPYGFSDLVGEIFGKRWQNPLEGFYVSKRPMPRKAPAKKSQPTASKKEASNVNASSKNRPPKPKRSAQASNYKQVSRQ